MMRSWRPHEDVIPRSYSEIRKAMTRQKSEGQLDMRKGELEEMRASILKDLQDIAAIKPEDAQNNCIMAATAELDAIVTATERAANNFYGAAKGPQQIGAKLRERGCGTAVQLRLPQAEASVKIAAEEPATGDPEAQGETVLVVEDDPVEDAPIQAAMRAQPLLDRGDPAGSAPWWRIGTKANVPLAKTTDAAVVAPVSRDSVQPVESVNQNPNLSDLPPPDIKRWRVQQKALVVTAVRTGLINVTEVCARYCITIEEFLSWKRLLGEHGLRGLRATRLQEYYRPASSASGKAHGDRDADADLAL